MAATISTCPDALRVDRGLRLRSFARGLPRARGRDERRARGERGGQVDLACRPVRRALRFAPGQGTGGPRGCPVRTAPPALGRRRRLGSRRGRRTGGRATCGAPARPGGEGGEQRPGCRHCRPRLLERDRVRRRSRRLVLARSQSRFVPGHGLRAAGADAGAAHRRGRLAGRLAGGGGCCRDGRHGRPRPGAAVGLSAGAGGFGPRAHQAAAPVAERSGGRGRGAGGGPRGARRVPAGTWPDRCAQGDRRRDPLPARCGACARSGRTGGTVAGTPCRGPCAV